MKILAVDTSSIVATAAIIDDHKLICEYILNNKKTHSQKIMPIINEILQSSELGINDIDLFAAANGPGSFTGLRIGVATIKGLAHATQKPVVGVSTLEGLAYNIPFSPHALYPIMDARREQVYNAVYKWESGNLVSIEGPRAISIDALIEEIREKNEMVVFNGDGVNPFMDILKSKLRDLCMFAPLSYRMQRASSIAELALIKAQHGETESYETFAPFYLRKSQAEREYEKNLCK